MFKVSNKGTRTTHAWRRSGAFIVNFEYLTPCSSVSSVNFEHVIAGWEKLTVHRYSTTWLLWKIFVEFSWNDLWWSPISNAGKQACSLKLAKGWDLPQTFQKFFKKVMSENCNCLAINHFPNLQTIQLVICHFSKYLSHRLIITQLFLITQPAKLTKQSATVEIFAKEKFDFRICLGNIFSEVIALN